ncbi:type II secretion system F family protein [Vibrio sp. M260112]|uniref:type II secretion system F family protein n=1 Tax=Vibrio sp. M260112 TaxID=3020895 RepID=UPI002F400D97
MMTLKHRPQIKAFIWKGIARSGSKVTGRSFAYSDFEVRRELKLNHINEIQITVRPLSMVERFTQQVKAKDITIVTRQIATMLSTGMPIISVLKLVATNQNKGEMKSILMKLSATIEVGVPLSQALGMTSVHFDPMYRDLVVTGEQTGKLTDVFERLASHREKSDQLKSNVVKALIYPSMVVLTALIVCYLMLTLVIPQFESIYAGFGADLPWLTKQVLHISSLSQDYLWVILLLFFLICLTFKSVNKRSTRFTLLWNQWLLAAPILGKVLGQAAIARFSRTMATSFSAGLPILLCLETAARTAGNLYYQKALERVTTNTASGMPMYVAMRQCEAFPEMVLQMVMIGEEAGKLDDMLNKIADIYEASVESSIDTLGKTLEPLIIIFLGSTVGGLVVAMYLPIFNLMNVLG